MLIIKKIEAWVLTVKLPRANPTEPHEWNVSIDLGNDLFPDGTKP